MKRRIKMNYNQLPLPFGEGRARAISYEVKERAFWLLAGTAVLFLLLYFYAIEATARNVALRANLETRLAEASGSLGALEFEHIALKNAVTREVALERGFREVANPLYVSREADSLTLNTEVR